MQSTPALGQPGTSAKRSAPVEAAHQVLLADGTSYDISQPIHYASPELVEALRQRVLALESALASSKRAKPALTAAAGPATSKPTSAAETKKVQTARLKAIFDRLKKECKSDNNKWRNQNQVLKLEEVLTTEEFGRIFGDVGTLLQPTPQNKPKSTVIIRHLNSRQWETLTSEHNLKTADLKGNVWSRGQGVPHPAPAKKLGSVGLHVQELDIDFSTKGSKLTLKFTVGQDMDDDRLYDGRWF